MKNVQKMVKVYCGMESQMFLHIPSLKCCLAKIVNRPFSGIKVWILPQQSYRQAFSVSMYYSGKLQVHVDVCISVCVCVYLCVCAWAHLWEQDHSVMNLHISQVQSFKIQQGWQCFLVKLFFIHFCEIISDTRDGDFVFWNEVEWILGSCLGY